MGFQRQQARGQLLGFPSAPLLSPSLPASLVPHCFSILRNERQLLSSSQRSRLLGCSLFERVRQRRHFKRQFRCTKKEMKDDPECFYVLAKK